MRSLVSDKEYFAFLDALRDSGEVDAPDFGTAVVAVAKNRHGACGTVELAFVRECGRFLDLVDDSDA